MAVPEGRKLHDLEEEKRRLKRLVAGPGPRCTDAEGSAIKKVATPEANRSVVRFPLWRSQHGISERRACRYATLRETSGARCAVAQVARPPASLGVISGRRRRSRRL
jgi:hypothetical protein